MPRRCAIPKFASARAIPFALALVLAAAPGCSRPPAQRDASAGAQHLPFDRDSPSASNGATLVPSGTRVPQGTFLTVRLNQLLSSATAHAGDTFEATIDDPVSVDQQADQQTLIPRGSPVTGHVLDSKAASSSPGYLRVTLVSLKVNGKIVVIETSSVFAKASPRNDSRANDSSNAGTLPPNDIVFAPDHRMTFRLAQPLDLQ